MPGRAVRSAVAVTLAAVVAAAVLVVVPAAAQSPATEGRWTPISRALEPLGPLVISAADIRWSICRSARVVRVDAEQPGAVYTLDGQPGCVLDGQRITHLKLAPRTGRCDAELTLFTSEKAWREAQPEAWGLVERAACP